MFKHFLITRFNLRNPKWISDKKNVAVLTDEWHENRFKLFDEFCFKSVSAQTNTNFEWLVFFDTTTPQKFKEHIAEMREMFRESSIGFEKFKNEINSRVGDEFGELSQQEITMVLARLEEESHVVDNKCLLRLA